MGSNKKNVYPDFIKELVDLNIEKSSSTLEIYWNEIKELVDNVFTQQDKYDRITIDELSLAKETIETIINCIPINIGNSYDRINDFIKAITFIEILLNNNITKVSIPEAKTMTVIFLKISKITDNNEMKRSSINIAKLIDRYDSNDYYPGMFVKEKSKITPLKDLIFNN